jgi:hypothetical protein
MNSSGFFVSIIHYNLRSIRNKITELEEVLIQKPVHILCINEHWLHQEEIDLYVPNDYILLHSYCRESGYGGVAVYLRKDLIWPSEIINLSEICVPRTFETVGIIIPNLSLILFALYHAPDSDFDLFLDKLDVLYNITKRHQNYRAIIVGDFNVDIFKLDSIKFKKFSSALNSINYSYWNNLPTREDACLDNILSDTDSDYLTCGIIAPPLSDHLGLWAILYYTSDMYFNELTNNHIITNRCLNINNINNCVPLQCL